MNVPLLALTVRSLREDARSWWTHSMRGLLVAVLLFSLWVVKTQSAFMGAPGLYLLTPILYIDLVFITLLGLGVFAAVITEEKEQMSLGLLKMTGMNPLSILLGKSLGALILAAVLLAVQLPFTFLAIALGGVSVQQILAAYMLLIAYTLFIYSVGLFASVTNQRSSSASGLLFLVLVTINIGPYLGPALITAAVSREWLAAGSPFVRGSLWLSARIIDALPFQSMAEVLFAGFAGSILGYAVVVHLVAAAAWFGLAWLVFDRATLEEQPSAPERPVVRPANPRKWWAGRAWAWAPIFWKDYRFVAGGWVSMFFVFITYGVALGLNGYLFYKSNRGRWEWEEFSPAALAIILGGIILHAAAIASSTFSDEVKWKTLSGLAILPISLGRVAYAKTAAALLQLLPGLVWLVIVILAMPDSLQQDLRRELDQGFFEWLVTAAVVVFAWHLAALLSVCVRRGPLALTIGIVFLGGILFVSVVEWIVLPMISPARGATGAMFRGTMEVIYTILVIALFITTAAMHPLIGYRLRTLAAE